jgi:hypothetical protein
MKPDTVRTSIDVPRELHRRLKKAAAERGCSARQLILKSIESSIEVPPEPKQINKRRLDLRKPLIPSTGRPLNINNEIIQEILDADY